MKCLHSTVNDTLALDAGNGVHNVEWLTDSAFGVHLDFERHIGGTMSFMGGKGSAINISAKQKLNEESSMVAEPVGVDCILPLALRALSFLKDQGCEVKDNIIKQDNKSANFTGQ